MRPAPAEFNGLNCTEPGFVYFVISSFGGTKPMHECGSAVLPGPTCYFKLSGFLYLEAAHHGPHDVALPVLFV